MHYALRFRTYILKRQIVLYGLHRHISRYRKLLRRHIRRGRASHRDLGLCLFMMLSADGCVRCRSARRRHRDVRPACDVDMADVIHKQQQCIADLRRWRRLCTALLPSLSILRADAVNDGASESQPVYVMALMSERLICPATAAPCLQCGSESTMSSKTFKPSTRCTKMSPVLVSCTARTCSLPPSVQMRHVTWVELFGSLASV